MNARTIAEHAVHEYVDENMANPEFIGSLAEVLQEMRDGAFPAPWVDIVAQNWERYPLTLYDAWPFAWIWGARHTNNLYVARVTVGAEPCADAARD